MDPSPLRKSLLEQLRAPLPDRTVTLYRSPPQDASTTKQEEKESESDSNSPLDFGDLPEQTYDVAINETLFKIQKEIESMRQEMKTHFKNMDYRKVKKNRTMRNRCTFVNRRGDNCKGYICKVPGSSLCYAHHILASSNKYPEQRKKLY